MIKLPTLSNERSWLVQAGRQVHSHARYCDCKSPRRVGSARGSEKSWLVSLCGAQHRPTYCTVASSCAKLCFCLLLLIPSYTFQLSDGPPADVCELDPYPYVNLNPVSSRYVSTLRNCLVSHGSEVPITTSRPIRVIVMSSVYVSSKRC